MYVLMTYDVKAERTGLFRKLLRCYLTHTQYSVFSGDLSKAKLFELRKKIAAVTIPGDRITEITASNRHNVKVAHLICNESGKGEVRRMEDNGHKTDFQVV